MILNEFDPLKNAVINPWDIVHPVDGMPKVAVSCFSNITFDRMISELDTQVIAWSGCANGQTPIYRTCYKGIEVALFMMDVGAPMSVGMMEQLFVMGVEKVVVFGTCGVLDHSISDCSIIIPNSAIRDEGTSYHYAPPSDEIPVNEKYLPEFTKMLDELKIKYTIGKTWSVDAFYRETREKVIRRQKQGCICVDMECSAISAVTKFRQKDCVQFFYAADNLDAETWDARSLSNHSHLEEKDRIAAIALELAVRISQIS